MLVGTGVWQIMVVRGPRDVGGHAAVHPAADHHPGLRAVGASWSRWRRRPRRGSSRWLDARGRLHPGAAGGHRRSRRTAAQAGPAGRPGAGAPGVDPGGGRDRAARSPTTQAGDEVLAQARRTDEALAELERCDRRGPGGGPAVAVPAPAAGRHRGVRPAVRPAGPRQPQPPGAGPALRGRAVARRGGAGRVPGPDDRAGRGDALHGHRAPERAAAHPGPGPAGDHRSGHLPPRRCRSRSRRW